MSADRDRLADELDQHGWDRPIAMADDVLTTDWVERIKREAHAAGRREALEEVAQAWQWGAWADVLPAGRGMTSLERAQRVTDWLRARVHREPPP